MITTPIIIGKRVKISQAYGGGTGKIIEIAPGYSEEYIIVKIKNLKKIYHISDLTY